MKDLIKLFSILWMCFVTNVLSASSTCSPTKDRCEVDLKTAIDWANSKDVHPKRDLRPDENREYDWETTASIDLITVDNYLLITEMCISGNGLSDDELKYLCPFSSVKELQLYQDNQEIQLTGSGLYQLRFMKDLKALDLDANQINPDNLCFLTANTALEDLRLYDNPLCKNPKGLECVSKLENLRTILFQGSRNYQLTDSCIEALKLLEQHQKLENIIFSGNLITDEGFREVICSLKQISYLSVSANSLTGSSFDCLKNFENLTGLKIGAGGPFGKETNKISDDALNALLNIPNLQNLYIGFLKFTDVSALIRLKDKGVVLYNLSNKVLDPEEFHISHQSDTVNFWGDDD